MIEKSDLSQKLLPALSMSSLCAFKGEIGIYTEREEISVKLHHPTAQLMFVPRNTVRNVCYVSNRESTSSELLCSFVLKINIIFK